MICGNKAEIETNFNDNVQHLQRLNNVGNIKLFHLLKT